MKIGFEGKRATHNFRGLGNYSRGIMEGLITYYPENQLYLYSPPYKDPKALHWLEKHPTLNIRTPQNFFTRKFHSFWRSFLLESDIKKENLDIFHGLSHEIPKVSSNRNYKLAVTIHDLIYLRYPEYFPRIDRMVYDKKFKYSTQNSDLVIAICEQTKNDLIEFFNTDPKKVVVHYQSCSPLFYSPRNLEEINLLKKNHQLHRPYILNVGAFEERKNQKSAVLAFSQIASKFEVDLVLVGNGKKYLHEVKELIHNLKLENRVKILTHFPYHSLPVLYQGAEMFFFPSHFEGFGIPIVEALFSKIPVITSEGSCFPESAGPDSLYFNSQSIDQMAAQLIKVLENKTLSNEISEKGYQYAQKFHLENTTSNLVQIYKSLLN